MIWYIYLLLSNYQPLVELKLIGVYSMSSLTFYGAVNDVTGSCYLLETDKSQVLLECGLFQGGREEEEQNEQPFLFNPKEINAIVLSHAHLDHSGRLPIMVKQGFTGPIFMTRATAELLEVMLKDAAGLMQRDVEWENKRRRRSGKDLLEPLYDLDDVENTLRLCEAIRYDTQVQVTDQIEVCFQDAGHILGSAIVEIYISEANTHKKLVFSGDLGNSCMALLKDPRTISQADVLLMESTYGDRDHKSMDATLEEFSQIIQESAESGGNVIIPSFAVGRTQELLFRLGELYHQGKLKQSAVFLDSPMAIATTEIYHRFQDTFNSEDAHTLAQANAKSLHRWLPNLQYTRTSEESMALNRITGGAIIIAGSGMCTGGRVRHHLKHNLWRRDAHVLIVGYQAYGTLGRKLVDGAKQVSMFGEDIRVNAHIHTIGGFSAHAGQSQLIEWLSHFQSPRPDLYLVHGEQESKQVFQKELDKRLGWKSSIAEYKQRISI